MREEKLHRLTDFIIPNKKSLNYLYYSYYLPDLKTIFNKYIKEGDSVFDIGCGNKPYEKYIRSIIKRSDKYGYVGCDVIQSSENKVDIICEATNVLEESNKYDVVISTQVIEHIFDNSKVFSEAFRLLRTNGLFIVSSNLIWPMHEEPYDFFRFTKYGFTELLNKAGFQIEEIKESGGKWATLGQLMIFITYIPHCESDFWLKKKFKTLIRRSIILSCNYLFKYLENHYKDTSKFVLNYEFVGRKV